MFPSTATSAAALAAVNRRLPCDEKLESDNPNRPLDDSLTELEVTGTRLIAKEVVKPAGAWEPFDDADGTKIGVVVVPTLPADAKTETTLEPWLLTST